MFRWCSYCCRFLGEKEPLDRYEISHGICEACAASVKSGDFDAGRIESLRDYQQRLLRAAPIGDEREIDRLINDGTSLGIRPEDLLVGLLQPLLYDIGEKWARGEVSVADEHNFSSLSLVIIEALFARARVADLRQSQSPRVLLICAEGNYHFLGLRMIEFLLIARGIPVFAIYPGIPARQACGLSRDLEPDYIGVSVALPGQMDFVARLEEMFVDACGRAPRIVVGGSALRRMANPPAADRVTICTDLDSALALFTARGGASRGR